MPTTNITRAVIKRMGDTIAMAMRADMQPNTYFTVPRIDGDGGAGKCR
jgi:hypothetical protein